MPKPVACDRTAVGGERCGKAWITVDVSDFLRASSRQQIGAMKCSIYKPFRPDFLQDSGSDFFNRLCSC